MIYLTVKDVAALFRLKKDETVREWIKKGLFPHIATASKITNELFSSSLSPLPRRHGMGIGFLGQPASSLSIGNS